MRRGLFICFEGLDGAGKTTQIQMLRDVLTGEGHDVLCTREPGGSPIAEKVRSILLDRENTGMTPVCEAYLYAAARAEHLRQTVRPALAEGKIVLCDRYVFSSIAYQGFGRELGEAMVLDINAAAMDGLWPDVTFFMDVPFEEGRRRTQRRGEADRLEMEEDAFHQRVRKGFLHTAEKNPSVVLLRAAGTRRDTFNEMWEELQRRFHDFLTESAR
jgi:dTMP kinase